MNDIKDLLISRISDIKLLQQQKLKASFSHPESKQQIVSKVNFKCSNTRHLSQKREYRDSQSRRSQSPSKSFQHNLNEQSYQMSQRQNKISALIRKKQKGRSFTESKFFNTVNMLSFLNERQIQEFYFHFVDIFASFDPHFTKYKNPAYFLTISMGQNLKKVFSFFFIKHEESQKCKQLVPEILGRQIWDLSPAFFLGLIRKWSTNLLNSLLNLNEDRNECKIDIRVDLKKIQNKILNRNFIFDSYIKEDKNTYNFIAKKQSRQSPNNTVKQITQKRSNSFRAIIQNLLVPSQSDENFPDLSLNTKEMVYAYFLDDLKKYYKNFPLEDLDIGYLRNIKKVGRKQDILSNQNLKNAAQILFENKNSHVKALMTDFQVEYAKFKQREIQLSSKTTQTKNSHVLTHQNQIEENSKNSDRKKDSLKDLQVTNLKNLFDLNSKLLTPPLNKIQSYKNRIKFSNQKNQQILCENLTGELIKQKSHSNIIDKQKNQPKLIDYNNMMAQKISQETSHIENKIKLLKRINMKNKDLNQKYFGVKRKISRQQKYSDHDVMECFVDEHIEPNQKISKLPKIVSREKTIENQLQCPQDCQINGLKNHFIERRNKEYSLDQKKLKNSSIGRQKLFFQQENRVSQQLSAFLPRKSTACEKNKFNESDINRRFLSETAEKLSIGNTSIEENQRPLSNFSFKSKAFGGSKKTSLNVIKLGKNKQSIKNQFGAIQNVETIHQKIRSKFGFKTNTSQDLVTKNPSNIFSSEKSSFQVESNKDDFIRYLQNLQNQKFLSQKSKCTPSKQKMMKKNLQ